MLSLSAEISSAHVAIKSKDNEMKLLLDFMQEFSDSPALMKQIYMVIENVIISVPDQIIVS